MGHHHEKTSTIFTRLAYGHGRKRRPPISRSPVPQTSLIFELPDELILSIISRVSPEPQFAGLYARLRLQYAMVVDDYHQQRARCLLSLSMTCRTMRLRLRSWVWEHIECPELVTSQSSGTRTLRKLHAITKTLLADTSLATSVRFMMVSGMWNNSTLPKFVKCLESLPNLHTLEIGQAEYYPTPLLRSVLGHVELPQVKTLILPLNAYPLLKMCRNVEEVVCVFMGEAFLFDEFYEPLTSNQDSKLRRLTVPLISPINPSKYLVALPRLTELTILYPHPYHLPDLAEEFPFNVDEAMRFATLDLVDACKALPDFRTFQIVQLVQLVQFVPSTPSPSILGRWLKGHRKSPSILWNQLFKEQAGGLKGWAMANLKKAETRCLEGEGRKRTTLRVIELSANGSLEGSHLDSLTVEEYEV